MKQNKTYYIIWVEGITPLKGEKIKSITNTGYDYTTKMTEALRIKQSDEHSVKHYLVRHGISEKYITFVKTNYSPKGCLLNLNRIQL